MNAARFVTMRSIKKSEIKTGMHERQDCENLLDARWKNAREANSSATLVRYDINIKLNVHRSRL
jgi:hypothetical protein